jgi:hypothetical protein
MSQKTRVERALENLAQSPLVPGMVIPVERFEEVLGLDQSHPEFNWLISAVRRALFEQGIYISGEGLSETGGYSVINPREHYWVAKLAMARAERDLEGKQILMINTKLEGFSPLELARHESTLNTLSLRLEALRKVAEHNRRQGEKRKHLLEEETE